MTDKASVQVEIFGQNYSVHAGADPDYVRELASYVDKKMRNVSQSSVAIDTLRAAVLTALNLADEVYRLRREHGDPAVFKKRTEALIHELDVVMKDA
jgi:cell division protein ZapA (FtsZ GTPase activity inhibitor)